MIRAWGTAVQDHVRKMTRLSGSLLAKYKEMFGGSRLLHTTLLACNYCFMTDFLTSAWIRAIAHLITSIHFHLRKTEENDENYQLLNRVLLLLNDTHVRRGLLLRRVHILLRLVTIQPTCCVLREKKLCLRNGKPTRRLELTYLLQSHLIW